MIPKILHFVWVQGLDAMPADYRRCFESWAPLHPEWEVILWSRDNMPPLRNAWALDLPTATFVSDVVRFEVVHQMGGVYLDCDHECMKPIDDIVAGKSAFVSMRNSNAIENSGFGGVPSAEWLREIIDALDANRDKLVHSFDTDTYYWMVMRHHPEVVRLPHCLLQTMGADQDRWKCGDSPHAVHHRIALWTQERPEYANAYGRVER
jgi:hypothetical protein